MLIAEGDRVRVFAVARDEAGRESELSNLPGDLRADPMGDEIHLTTDALGEAMVDLTQEMFVRPGRMVTLRAQGGELSDE